MDHQEDRSRPNGSNRNPSLLVVERQVTLRDGEWIVEDKNGSLKTDIMLAKVPPVLVLVPFKSHDEPRSD